MYNSIDLLMTGYLKVYYYKDKDDIYYVERGETVYGYGIFDYDGNEIFKAEWDEIIVDDSDINKIMIIAKKQNGEEKSILIS